MAATAAAALLRTYLVVAGVFELLSVAQVRAQGATKTSPVLRELVGGGRNAEERRGIDLLWIAFLLNLAMARFALAVDLFNKPLLTLVLGVHVAESALFFLAVPVAKLRPEHWAVPFAAVQAAVLGLAWVLILAFVD